MRKLLPFATLLLLLPLAMSFAQEERTLDENCLGCHIDETQLQELAVEEEDTEEELSQGPG